MKDYNEVAKSWIEGNFDPETKCQVLALRNTDPTGFEDAFYKSLEFGTGGLRGIMGVGTNRMNKYTVGMATQGLANYINAHVEGARSVCISFDSRNNSKLFARISADVLSNNGIHVYLFDNLRPTPELSYAIRAKGATAGIMVTASHNPKEYNGYKVFWSDGGQITAPVDKDIIAEVNKITDPDQVRFESAGDIGGIEPMGREMDEAYLKDILSLTLSPESVARHPDIKIVYTPLHGCGVRLVPEALSRLGFKNVIHVPEQDISDGDFPTVVSPNPEEPAAMKMALAKADETGADIVMATDPDADRLGIAVRDDAGNMVQFNGNQTAAMLTYYILTRWKELGNAVSAVSKDPRFDPVTEDELKYLDINVDVLGDAEPIKSPAELDVKKYGVIVQSGYKRGLLLPDLDGVDTVEQQIDIARRKGGIAPDEKIELFRFEVVRHADL